MLYPDELQARLQKMIDDGLKEMRPTCGRGREIRTPDILLPKQARYQAALHPVFFPSESQNADDTPVICLGQVLGKILSLTLDH